MSSKPARSRASDLSAFGLGLLVSVALLNASVDQAFADRLTPRDLGVSQVQYDGNNFGSSEVYPYILAQLSASGVQGSLYPGECAASPDSPAASTLPLTGITVSFSSESKGAVALSANGACLTYVGSQVPDQAGGVSNSHTPGYGEVSRAVAFALSVPEPSTLGLVGSGFAVLSLFLFRLFSKSPLSSKDLS